MRLAHQVAIVTGGSSAIGAGVAAALGREGAAVVVNYLSHAEGAEDVVADIHTHGGRAIAVEADVSSEPEVEALFARTLEAFGRLDILVANAGIQKDAAFRSMTLAEWSKVIEVNLTGQFLTCRPAVRQFCEQGIDHAISRAAGKIICMSSVHDVIPWAGHVNYAASKGGLMLMMKSLAQEVAADRIRVNEVSPGAIKTAINRQVWEDPDSAAKLLELIPYGRLGEPEDVACAVAWLASDDSDYVTGTTLCIDGGMMLYPGFADNG